MKPLAVSSYTVTSAVGRGRAAHIAALRAEKTGLAEQRFADATLPCWIGAVAGLESVDTAARARDLGLPQQPARGTRTRRG